MLMASSNYRFNQSKFAAQFKANIGHREHITITRPVHIPRQQYLIL